MHTLLCGHEAQDGEDHEASKEAGPAVDECQDDGIPGGGGAEYFGLSSSTAPRKGKAGQGRAGQGRGGCLLVAVVVEAIVAA